MPKRSQRYACQQKAKHIDQRAKQIHLFALKSFCYCFVASFHKKKEILQIGKLNIFHGCRFYFPDTLSLCNMHQYNVRKHSPLNVDCLSGKMSTKKRTKR